jgi:hypothetical protein
LENSNLPGVGGKPSFSVTSSGPSPAFAEGLGRSLDFSPNGLANASGVGPRAAVRERGYEHAHREHGPASAPGGSFTGKARSGALALSMDSGTSPLGRCAKSSSALPDSSSKSLSLSASSTRILWTSPCPETGEIVPFTLEADRCRNAIAKLVYDPVAARVERFALQSVARKILPQSRTAKCLRVRRPDKTEIEVFRSVEHGTAHYGGLQVCSSVWACPVCAAKISERRRAELLRAMEAHKAGGGEVLLLTLTNPHYLGDRLDEILAGQQKAMSRFNGAREARKLWESIGCVGTVRAWEVTHGDNGWHPHFHLLLFVRSGLDLDGLLERFSAVWANSCRLAGLPIPSDRYGVTLEDGSKAAAYASKWGLENEMTKGHVKKAKKGRTPFDLLRAYMNDGDRQAAALFKEFADNFKGKRQLVWSKGLKALFEVQELTDAELATAPEDRAELLGTISLDQWRVIVRLDLRADVLELARFGWEPVQLFLSGLGIGCRHLSYFNSS